jgi:hypothetical protein
MISIKIVSDKVLVIQVKNNLNKVEFERISLYIESLLEWDFQTTLQFVVNTKTKEQSKREIEAYCEMLPYNYQIL